MKYETSSYHDWVVDLVTMTCRNKYSHIKVQFSIKDESLVGEIVKMPMELVMEWLKQRKFCSMEKKVLIEARTAFIEKFKRSKAMRKIEHLVKRRRWAA